MSRVLEIALPVPVPGTFDYLPPEGEQADDGWLRTRVLVPLGRRRLVGVVLGVREASVDPGQLRRAERRLDDQPLLTPELVDSLSWAARYYQHPVGEVFAAALPAALRHADTRLPARETLALTDAGHAALAAKSPRAGSAPRGLLEALAAGPLDAEDLIERQPRGRAALRSLRERGLVASVAAEPARPRPAGVAGPTLNAEQRQAVDTVSAALDGFHVFLLDGVTGSGKTEVYLALIERVLAAGRQALVLVPEIGLTPQALARYRSRLGVPVAATHSGLADGERARSWLDAGAGRAPVLLGTRSAVLAPLARPGLIVVDEEHDASYKQQDGFRYHARDFAAVRARALGIPLVLGSATPALESLANARAGRYTALRLAQRAGAASAPQVRVVDLRRQRLVEGLSAPLLGAIGDTVARGEQALVFRNRRGFAPLLLCHACGWHARCPRCETPLTLHRAIARLRCHHCGHAEREPATCPDCDEAQLLALGAGTERLEVALNEQFPGTPVSRIDRDTTRGRAAREQRFAALEREGPAILVGTQMLAKGHDLPNLTLAAIVDADGGLFSADFRGAERLAQLVIQVAGRAGRGARPGTVLLQTHHPEHPLLRRLLEGGYHAFADDELQQREAMGLPPFGHLALLRAEAKSRDTVDTFLAAARRAFGTQQGVVLRGPLPAPMPRRAGFVRAQLLLESPQRGALQAALTPWIAAIHALPDARRVRWSIDVDPIDLA
jgi:primosomal protein N' (replication factor Y)